MALTISGERAEPVDDKVVDAEVDVEDKGEPEVLEFMAFEV